MSSYDLLQPKRVLKIGKRPHPQFLNNAFADPYLGCEFGCSYCYGVKEENADSAAQESPCRVGVKTNSAFALKKELGELAKDNPNPREGKISIGLSFATDPYQLAEKQYQLTLRALETAKQMQYPVQIITKSELVLRDLRILSELSAEGLCIVTVSLFTLNEDMARSFEPRLPSPARRLEIIEKLRGEGIACGAALMPIFPHLTDGKEDLEAAFEAIGGAGALYCVPGILSLSQKVVRERVMRILSSKFPGAAYQYAVVYDKEGRPSAAYCEKMEKLLKLCSEKYSIPSVLPVAGAQVPRTLVVQDTV